MGLAIPGRYNSSIRFRGMDVNTLVPTFRLATLFVDGIYVPGNIDSISFDDVERAGVVTGPQSAYVGRNTCGGAVKHIKRTPSTTDFSGSLNVSGASYDEHGVSAGFEGPLIADKLGFRVGGRIYSKGAMWHASDGGGPGEESTKSFQGTLFATPTDHFKARVRFFYASDSDGPAAGGFIPGRLNDTCSGKTLVTNTGQSIQRIRFICGMVPEQGQARNSRGGLQIIDSNTTARSAQAFAASGDRDFLPRNLIQAPLPSLLDDRPRLDGIGLERRLMRIPGMAEYESGDGITATLHGGYNTQKTGWVRDFNCTRRDTAYSRDPQDLTDHSIEFHVASSANQRLRWLVGVNSCEQDLILPGQGGASAYIGFDSAPGLAFGSCVPRPSTAAAAAFPNALANTDRVDTLGIYGSLAYDLADKWTLNLEGRSQHDQFTRGTVARQTVTFENFIPRVILQYKPSSSTNRYASYSAGIIPGELNQSFIDGSDFVKQQLASQGIGATLEAEELESYELGWKQQMFEDRLQFNVAAHYGERTNENSRIQAPLQRICGEPLYPVTSAGCRTALGEAPVGQPARSANGQSVISITNAVVSGASRIWGAEFEADALIAEGWTGGMPVDYARNEFTTFTANVFTPYARFNNVKGNSSANCPRWSGSLDSTCTARLTDNWQWFVRGDPNCCGKTYVEVDSLGQCSDCMVGNARIGSEKHDMRIGFFSKTVFNDRNWTACSRCSELDLPADFAFSTACQGVMVAPRSKRQFGIRASKAF